jgi:hypothetical protein
MLAQLSQWLLIAAIGQAPPEAALAKAAPADIDAVVRIRGLETARDDILAMLKAMNPDWANAAEGGLSTGIAHVRERHGDRFVQSPGLVLLKFGDEGGAGGPPPFAALLPTDDYQGTLKSLVGKDPELKHQDGGYDELDGPDGNTWYAAKAPGVAAFGTSKDLIAAIAKHDGKTLDSVLTGEAAKAFYRGDAGLFLNATSLTKRFGDQIEQGRQMLMAGIDQAAQAQGNAGMIQMIKDIYGKLFDSLKFADHLALGLDAKAEGLHLAGFLAIKSDSDLAKSITDARPGDLAPLGKLPAGATTYASMDVSAKTFEALQGMGLRMLTTGGKPSPELERAMAEFHGLGRIEHLTAMSMEKGMTGLSVIGVEDARKYMAAAIDMLRAMGPGEGKSGVYKELKVDENAKSYRDLMFTHVTATMDIQKLAEAMGNQPAQLESLKAMFGDGKLSYWYAPQGKRALFVIAPTWEDARAQIDPYLGGQAGVGEQAQFKAVRAELPERASALMIFHAQGLVRMMAKSIGATLQKPDLKAPEDMPKDPAYLGASLTPHAAKGYEFHLAVPGPVGAVIAKGFLPMVQGLAPPGANQ